MRKVGRWLLLLLALVGLSIGSLCYVMRGEPLVLEGHVPAGRAPRLRPDYAGTVIPPNIAPLSFCIAEPGRRYCVRISSARGEAIEVVSDKPGIAIPFEKWKTLLAENRGQELRFDVYAKGQDGSWRRFETVANRIAREDVDSYVAYRIINVLYRYYKRMEMYQRNVENYDESLILDNRSFGDGCMNCHTFLNNRADKMVIQVRSGGKDYGAGMLLIEDGVVSKVDARTPFNPGLAAFASWHPGGRVLAFSINRVRQFFHSARAEVREGIDFNSDLALYLLDSNAVTSTGGISDPERLETWPAWSPDGEHLYFSSAPRFWFGGDEERPAEYDKVRYDLMRINYEAASGAWGELETVLSADQTGSSITLPRLSPDGRFVLFCMAEYGGFPALSPSADMYLMDLSSGEYSRLACNSDESDSWHSWSSNGRWIAFSSKRGDGLFMKVYFSYIDENGVAHKPFVLPQEDPAFYDSFIRVYHLPELASEPIPLRGEKLARVIRSAAWSRVSLPVTSATPRSSP